MNGDYGFGHFGGGFIGIIFWIIVIAAIVMLFRLLSDNRSSNDNDGDRSESALEILNKRYARGEIDQQEYERKKREISRN